MKISKLLIVITLLNFSTFFSASGQISTDDTNTVAPELESLVEELGDAETQFNLGWMLIRGEGVPQDYNEAVKWFRLAAEKGYAEAQLHLGTMYKLGEGVPQDDKEAVKWIRLAAEQGHAEGQSGLGVMYYFGEGILQDITLSYMWLNLSSASGDSDAKEMRDTISREMTSEQIAEGQRLSRQWLEKFEAKK